ncbi:thioesterase-like superfamily-domain-containing protein [Penicillium waksmanii]|uniref:thioesterase-like superfamily-domain-containing protein n=1 Tax=Penicillium waksmanii TaxID=69791 RepID=UPI0025494528|nr:thioesterase-like superfamily-domain-containing protein [Penicillium waksmanii]KAJ5980839.1 thioesterase-like superfamily-domain-containing protein [Penicillium waksmanii]
MGVMLALHQRIGAAHLIPPGAFHVQFDDLKLSQRDSTAQAIITSLRVKNETICSLAIFTVGDLNTKVGIKMELPPIPAPDRERECACWTNALFYKLNPATASARYYNPKDGKSPLWGPKGGQTSGAS